MKDQTIPPHHNRNSIIAVCETVRADEQPLALREEPDAKDEEEVDKIA